MQVLWLLVLLVGAVAALELELENDFEDKSDSSQYMEPESLDARSRVKRQRGRSDCRGNRRRNPGCPPVNPACNGHRRFFPECMNLTPLTAPITQALQSVTWLTQLTTDNESLHIPNLPDTPQGAQQSRFFQLGTGKPDTPFQVCSTPFFEPGHCRFLQHCILPQFASNFNVFLRYVCFIESSFVGVCCPDSRYPSVPTTTPPPPTTTTLRPLPATPPTSRGCGLSAKPPTRIVGGANADPQEYPWMAALMRAEAGAQQYCGGVLITDRHVLTAAHCVDGFTQESITVRLGEYTFTFKENTDRIDFKVAGIRMHEAYSRETYVNDLAILALDRSTTFNNAIWPICLPPAGETFEGQTATITGWGTIYYGGPTSATLQEVAVPVWTNADCDAAYTQDIVDNFLCAGEKQGKKDSCQGDSGGPLQLRLGPQARWNVIGVVSWGIRCAEPGYPGVYTRINKYLDWIKTNAV